MEIDGTKITNICKHSVVSGVEENHKSWPRFNIGDWRHKPPGCSAQGFFIEMSGAVSMDNQGSNPDFGFAYEDIDRIILALQLYKATREGATLAQFAIMREIEALEKTDAA